MLSARAESCTAVLPRGGFSACVLALAALTESNPGIDEEASALVGLDSVEVDGKRAVVSGLFGRVPAARIGVGLLARRPAFTVRMGRSVEGWRKIQAKSVMW